MSLRLSKRIINKNELFEWFNKDIVEKIELKKHDNKNLNNPNVCKVYIYLIINNNTIFTILDACQTYNHLKIGYLKGIINQKREGWLSVKMITKLKEIEKQHKINLNIPKELKLLIEKYDKYNK